MFVNSKLSDRCTFTIISDISWGTKGIDNSGISGKRNHEGVRNGLENGDDSQQGTDERRTIESGPSHSESRPDSNIDSQKEEEAPLINNAAIGNKEVEAEEEKEKERMQKREDFNKTVRTK